MTSRPAETGFSLVETLVALAIISAMVAVLFNAISAEATASQELGRRRAAILVTQSLLEQAVTPDAGREMPDVGRGDGFAWRVARRTLGTGARDSAPPLEDLRIEVADADTGRRLTSVRTLRLAR